MKRILSSTAAGIEPAVLVARALVVAAVLFVLAAGTAAAQDSATAAARDSATAGARDSATAVEQRDPVPGREEVLAVIDAFHRALAEGDSARVLSALHAGVTIYEAGHAENLEQYRSGHLASDMEFARGVRSTVVDEWVGMSEGHSIVGRVYSAKGTFREREVDALTTETMFLVQQDAGEWRIRHIHWSSRRASPPAAP